MAQTQKTYLGSGTAQKLYLGDKPIIVNQSTPYKVREDAFASYVKLAVPGSVFGNINENPYDDIHHLINTSESQLSLAPTGSTASVTSSYYYPSGSIVNSGSYNFADDGYTTSIVTDGQYGIGNVAGNQFNFGGKDWVVEVWFMADEELNNPPYSKPFLSSNVNYPDLEPQGMYLRIFTNSSISSTSHRFNIQNNQGVNFDNQTTLDGTGEYAVGNWHHYAVVGSYSGGNTPVRFYEDGIFKEEVTITGAISQATAYTFLGQVAYSNDNENSRWAAQDLRITVGSNRNYTGSLFEPPQSLVQKLI